MTIYHPHGNGNQLIKSEISLVRVEPGDEECAYHRTDFTFTAEHHSASIPNITQSTKPNDKHDWILFIRPLKFKVKEK